MKQFNLISFLLGLCLFVGSCKDEEPTKGIDVGKVVINNATNNEIKIKSGTSLKVEYQFSPYEGTTVSSYTDLKYESSDTLIFKTTNDGLINARVNGTAQLSVTATGKKSDGTTVSIKGSCIVRVTDQIMVTKITLREGLTDTLRLVKALANSSYQLKPSDYIVTPENALIKNVVFASSNPTIASVDNNGLIKAVSGGVATILILSTDGSNAKAEIIVKVNAPIFTWYLTERKSFDFGAVPSFFNADGTGYGNKWEFLVDDGSVWEASFISISKPGKNGIPNEIGAVYIPIDMKKTLKFNQIYWRHRSTLTYARLRVWSFDLYGSADGLNYTLLESITIPGATVDAQNTDATIGLAKTYDYRYVKLVPSSWDTTNGSTMQISDLKIGYDQEKDNGL